jgi:hypothetical protein
MTLLEAYVFYGLPLLALAIGGLVYFVATRQLDHRAPAE